MTVFYPATARTLMFIAQDMGGIGNLKRKSAMETYIHNFMSTHDLAEQLPLIEEWFADCSDADLKDIATDADLAPGLLNTAPAFTMPLLSSFYDRCS